jgi:DNA-binding MarR family transcriptional regulator
MNHTTQQPPATDAANVATELRALVGKLKRRLREQADVGDFTPSQVSALLRLEKEGIVTASYLARAEGMRPQSMSTVIAALEAAGMVQGEPDPTDGRRILLSLTESCRQWVQRGRAVRQDWLSRALQTRLSAEELAVVGQAVGLLSRLADD